MAKLIVKSPYYNPGVGCQNYMRYIATRDGVELLPQSAMQNYLQYMATRPRAEHGLFGVSPSVDLPDAMREVQSSTNNVWTHIISLHREDAARLGYDNAQAWRNLLLTHQTEIADAMHIPIEDFHWYAAFHNEGEHPHIHMMAWSTSEKSPGFLSTTGIEQIRSALTNDVFRQEILHLYEDKSAQRDELVQSSRVLLKSLNQQITVGICDAPQLEPLLLELHRQLKPAKGKKQYRCLPKETKKLVNEIVDELSQLPHVKLCYQTWLKLQQQIRGYYSDKPYEVLPLSQQKEFRSVQNAVIQEALHLNAVTFEDDSIGQSDEPSFRFTLSEEAQDAAAQLEGEAETVEDLHTAESVLCSIAASGDANTQYALGKIYRDHIGVLPDAAKAVHWFQRSAESGNAAAQYALGKLLLDDPEVRNIPRGIACLRQAAAQDSPWAAYRLGKEYLSGEHVPKDIETACTYFKQAADSGNPYAQYILGKLFLSGQEIPEDREQALYWFSKSAEQGHPYAQYFSEHLNEPRSPSVMLCVTRLLYHLFRVFESSSRNAVGPQVQRMDRKRKQELMEQREALGLRGDPEESANQGMQYSGY